MRHNSKLGKPRGVRHHSGENRSSFYDHVEKMKLLDILVRILMRSGTIFFNLHYIPL